MKMELSVSVLQLCYPEEFLIFGSCVRLRLISVTLLMLEHKVTHIKNENSTK
jgi:hypothetical protein